MVVVVDEPAMLASRTSPLRRVAGAANAVATIVLGDDLEGLPSMCTEAFEIAEDAVAVRHRWSGFAAGGIANRFRITGASRSTVDEAARLMARFDDPERADQLGDLPARVDLFDIAGEHLSSSAMIAAAWNDAGEDPRPRAMLGAAGDGLIEIDLERDGPHTLIGGTTGAGKSELLRTMVASLAIASPPEALSFVLIDYKGGAAFDACARLPHVVGVVTDLDGRLASRVLTSLEAELHRRELLLRECSASDLSAYRAGRPAEPLARLVVVVDEFAALAADLPTFLDSLVSIAQRGRSLGVHLVLATQRPNGVINDDIRANTNLRIALRVQDRADALDVVGDPLPATLSRTRPGSAVIRLDAGEVSAFQTARCTGPPPADSRQRRPDEASAHQVTGPVTALELLVDRLIGAAECRAVARPRRPWLDPLPAVARRSLADPGARSPSIDANRPGLTVSSPGPVGEGMWVDPPSFGAVDVPEAQRLDSLGWDHRSGHLIVAGSVGSGTSTALATVAVTLAATRSAGRLHLYVIDASGGGGLDVSSGGGLDISGGGGLDVLGGLPHCAGVIGLGDDHRRSRLLRRLADEIADRQVHRASGRPDVILVVDGYATLRASLDSAARQEDADRLAVITQDGPRVGVSLAVSLDRPSDAPLALSARASARWLFGLVDPLEAAAWGIPARDALPPGRPGRCLRVESGHEAQVFVDPRPLAEVVAAVGGSGGPAKLGDLPAVVTFDDLLARDRVNLIQTEALTTQHEVVDSRPNDGRPTSVRMPVGLSVATLEPVVIELHEGEHLLVAGPARSGRSSALALLTAAWRFTHTDGWVGAVRPRRSAALTGLDADLDGTLTDVVAAAGELGERPGLIVVDDAELVDTDGGLTALLARPHHSVQVIASGRPDALRAAYGHWTAVIRRSRKGLLLGAVHDLDADVLGVVLPRHRDPHVVVGRGWTVADGMIEPTQFARMTVPVRLVA